MALLTLPPCDDVTTPAEETKIQPPCVRDVGRSRVEKHAEAGLSKTSLVKKDNRVDGAWSC